MKKRRSGREVLVRLVEPCVAYPSWWCRYGAFFSHGKAALGFDPTTNYKYLSVISGTIPNRTEPGVHYTTSAVVLRKAIETHHKPFVFDSLTLNN